MAPNDTADAAISATTKSTLPNEADLAQAFKEIAKGENAAAILEKKLSVLETKIDDLLAVAEAQQNHDQNPSDA